MFSALSLQPLMSYGSHSPEDPAHWSRRLGSDGAVVATTENAGVRGGGGERAVEDQGVGGGGANAEPAAASAHKEQHHRSSCSRAAAAMVVAVKAPFARE